MPSSLFLQIVENMQERWEKQRIVTPEEFEELGGTIMRRESEQKDAFKRRWASHFAVDPVVVSEVWKRLLPDLVQDRYAEPKHLLWAILFLTQYTNEADLAGKCGAIHEDTFRKWAWLFVEKLSSLESEIVSEFACLFWLCCCILSM
jgi:hypothetical protein